MTASPSVLASPSFLATVFSASFWLGFLTVLDSITGPSGPTCVEAVFSMVETVPSSTVTLKLTETLSPAPTVSFQVMVPSASVPSSEMESATSVVPVGTLSVMVTSASASFVLV